MKYSEKQKYEWVSQYYNGEKVMGICLKNNIPRSTFYNWMHTYKIQKTEAGYEVSAVEFAKLRQRVEKQEQVIKVLKQVDCIVSASLKEKLYALEKLHGQFSVHVLCEALEVDRGTYYNHVFRNKKKHTSYQLRRDNLSIEIKEIFEASNQIFGAKKIKAVLSDRGIYTSDKMVAELMKEMNLQSIRTDSKKVYTQQSKNKKKDMLGVNFSTKRPNEVWVSDMTYFRFQDKTYYICAILDLYSRKMLSHKVSLKQSTQLLTSTLKLAYAERRPDTELVFHSDRGSQYTSNRFRTLLKSLGIKQSFSPKAKPQHNAVMEAFFSSVKKEELYRRQYRSEREFKESIQKYFNFYNTERPHSSLAYKAPNTCERVYFELSERNKK